MEKEIAIQNLIKTLSMSRSDAETLYNKSQEHNVDISDETFKNIVNINEFFNDYFFRGKTFLTTMFSECPELMNKTPRHFRDITKSLAYKYNLTEEDIDMMVKYNFTIFKYPKDKILEILDFYKSIYEIPNSAIRPIINNNNKIFEYSQNYIFALQEHMRKNYNIDYETFRKAIFCYKYFPKNFEAAYVDKRNILHCFGIEKSYVPNYFPAFHVNNDSFIFRLKIAQLYGFNLRNYHIPTLRSESATISRIKAAKDLNLSPNQLFISPSEFLKLTGKKETTIIEKYPALKKDAAKINALFSEKFPKIDESLNSLEPFAKITPKDKKFCFKKQSSSNNNDDSEPKD